MYICEKCIKNNYYVYEHRNKKTQKPFYIGKGKCNRAFEGGSRRSLYWNRIANKYGYSVHILFSELTEEEAFKKEIDLIKIYREKYKLVNLTNGGEGSSGLVFTKTHRKRISKSKLGKKMSVETIEKNRQAQLGKKLSKETKEKISASGKGLKRPPIPYSKRLLYSKIYTGRKHTKEAKKKMTNALNKRYEKTARYLLNTETGIFYRSGTEASYSINKDFGYFYQMMRGDRKNKTSFIYTD